jgi:hypothetical protein
VSPDWQWPIHWEELEDWEDYQLPVYGRERLQWRRAPRTRGGAVEIARVDLRSVGEVGTVAIRHSDFPAGVALLFSAHQWAQFTDAIVAGFFDQPAADNGGDGDDRAGTDLIGVKVSGLATPLSLITLAAKAAAAGRHHEQ